MLTMNYGKQAISRGLSGIGPTCSGERWMKDGGVGGRTRTVAAKSAASGTTNQIFAPTARSRGPLLLFICKAGLNYSRGKETTVAADSAARVPGPIVLLADRKHHCTTTTVRVVAAI